MPDPISRPSVDAGALVAQADHLVGQSPAQAVAVAERAIELARAQNDPVIESTAHRVSARAAWAMSDTATAMQTARTAVTLAIRSGSDTATVEARMLVAYLQHERGNTRAALAELDRAAEVTGGASSGRLWHQRGVILQRAGRAQEALTCYRRAAPILRRTGQIDRLARLYNNRGVLHSLQGSLHSARSDLEQARELYRELGQELMAADATWNLGFVAGRRGDIPAALARYAEAERIHAAHGLPNAELLLDRCELLMSAGLTDEARSTAERAVGLLQAAGMAAYRADALLMLAQALLADGSAEQARATARQAATLLTRQRRPRMAVIARFVVLRAEELGMSEPRSRRQLRTRALRLAGQLQAAEWRAHALDARIVAARAALDFDPATARRELQEAAAARRTGPIELRIRAWYAAALARLTEGDTAGAQRAVRAGLDVIARERALLGATELRVRMAGHGADLATLGVQLSVRSGRARQVLAAAERWRAGALHLRPVRPPDDEAVASALSELRQVGAELESLQRGSPEVTALSHRRQALEERVRRLTRQATGAGATRSGPPHVSELTAALGERMLIELVGCDGLIYAVTLHRGRTRLHRLDTAERFERLVAAAQFALRRLAVRHGPPGSARDALRTASERLAQLLSPALDAASGDTELVLVPTAAVQALPCGVVPGLRDRPVSVAPSAAAWLRAERRTPADPGGPVLLAAGPGLPGADAEIEQLSAAYPQARVLRADQATAAAAVSGMDAAQIAHLAAHGRLRRDNPLFSALQLADGPVTVYDLENVTAAPALVVLSACQSGVSSGLAGDEILGLTAALLNLGTRTVVATVIPVDDLVTRTVMTAMHEQLGRGLRPAAALSVAAARTRDSADPASAATVQGFVCFGAG